MNSTPLSGSSPVVGVQPQYAKRLSASTPSPKSSTSPHGADVINLGHYRAQRRAKQAAWNILLTAVVALAFITTAAALHREQRLQTMEAGR